MKPKENRNWLHRLKRIKEVYRPMGRQIKIGIAWDCLNQVCALGAPLFMGIIIDGIAKSKTLDELKWQIVGLYVSLAVRGFVYLGLDKQYIRKIAFDSDEVSSDATLTGISKLSVGQVINRNSGFSHDVVKKGESAIQDMVGILVTNVISLVLRVFIATLAVVILSRVMALATLAGIVLYIWVSIRINKRISPVLKQHTRLSNKLGTAYWERVKNLRLVLVANQQERMKSEFAAKQMECNDIGRGLWVEYVVFIHWFREPIIHLARVCVVTIAVVLASKGIMSSGAAIIAIGWSMHAFDALGMIGSLQRQISKNMAAIGRYFDLLDIPPAVKNSLNPVRPASLRGEIEFRGVSFSYPVYEGPMGIDDWEDDPSSQPKPKAKGDSGAIKNMSFRVPAGGMTAFVGPSGSGKSTAVCLMQRFYDPAQGKVLIDGIDLPLLDIESVRRSIGVVEQSPKLWDGTVRYNLTYEVNRPVTQEEIDEVCRIARIDEFFPRLQPKGLDTEIGENGVQLSGGQCQRIAIGRALLKRPNLMILDEATNALDPDNEAMVHEAMRDALKGRTSIVIAHRLSTIRRADQIVVFKAGGIAGIGTHDELMSSCEEYQRLVSKEVGMFVGNGV